MCKLRNIQIKRYKSFNQNKPHVKLFYQQMWVESPHHCSLKYINISIIQNTDHWVFKETRIALLVLQIAIKKCFTVSWIAQEICLTKLNSPQLKSSLKFTFHLKSFHRKFQHPKLSLVVNNVHPVLYFSFLRLGLSEHWCGTNWNHFS